MQYSIVAGIYSVMQKISNDSFLSQNVEQLKKLEKE
jgi:hypothetical protein